MNLRTTMLLASMLAGSTGCESYRDYSRSFGRSVGSIQVRDVAQADNLRAILPGYLGLPGDRMRVTADSGYTDLTLSGINDSATKKDIQHKLEDLRTQNPMMNPIELHFEKVLLFEN
jgi:hypothetical protein